MLLFAKYFIKVLKQNITTMDSLEVFYKARKGVEGTVRQRPEYSYINELEHAKGEFVFTARN